MQTVCKLVNLAGQRILQVVSNFKCNLKAVSLLGTFYEENIVVEAWHGAQNLSEKCFKW